MAVNVDIFNPQISTIAKGFQNTSYLIYGSNSLGKTAQAVRFPKPYVIATESGLNATVGVAYNRINSWADFQKVVRQLTSKTTVDRARQLYSSVIIDEVYSAALYCQDYVQKVIGQGALTLSDTVEGGKINLYQAYEKIFFKAINDLLSCDYTVVFIAHEQIDKNGKAWPKGDKRSIDPIRDFADYTIYLKSNGIDENNHVIPSSAFLAETSEYFARSRFPETPTYLKEWSVEALEEAVNIGIEAEAKKKGVTPVTRQEQKEQNTTVKYDFESTMKEIEELGTKMVNAGMMDDLVELVEDTLGKGKKVSDCTKKQIEALVIILDNLKEKVEELGL